MRIANWTGDTFYSSEGSNFIHYQASRYQHWIVNGDEKMTWLSHKQDRRPWLGGTV